MMEIKMLSKDAIADLFCATGNTKHRLLLMMAYSSGLPVRDVTRLRVHDVDPVHRRVYARRPEGVHCGLLSKMATATLRSYLTHFPVKTYLFSGVNERSHLSLKRAQEIFEYYSKKAGIRGKCTIDCLHASFHAHLREKLHAQDSRVAASGQSVPSRQATAAL